LPPLVPARSFPCALPYQISSIFATPLNFYDPTEVWIAGDLTDGFEMEGVHLFENPAAAIEDLKQKMRRDLEL
jgi:hypothetical protein